MCASTISVTVLQPLKQMSKRARAQNPEIRLDNFFVDSRRRTISENQHSIFISSLTRNQEPLISWPTTYLVVFVDLDQNEEVSANEFEPVELDFSR